MDHSGSNVILVIVCLVVAPITYYWSNVFRRRRNDIRFRLRRVGVYLVCLLVGIYGPTFGRTRQDAFLFSIFVGATAAFVLIRPPKTGRRIPKGVRRAVIARDLKGEAFDPNLHHLDHIVPYSKGGDHSVENLRVLAKHENLRRGARMPKIRDFN